MVYAGRGQHQAACELGEQLLSMAERAQDPLLVALARWQLGFELALLGAFAGAREHLEHVIAFYDAEQHHAVASRYGLDPGVMSLPMMSWLLWVTGYPDQSLEHSRRAMALAQALTHPISLLLAHQYAATLGKLRREPDTTRSLAEAELSLAKELGLPYWVAGALLCRAWALAEQGQIAEGMAQAREGLAVFRVSGGELLAPYALAFFAEVSAKAGQLDKGLAALHEALAMAHRNGEGFYEPEIQRLKGELLQARSLAADPVPARPADDGREAETCLLQAMQVARQQGARMWELRAAVSLCRLWQAQGLQDKREEGRRMLAEIYGWFSEGLDTVDLREAKRLLEER